MKLLKKLHACSDAIEWASNYDSLQAAWAACERADWMLWLLAKMRDTPGWPPRHAVVRLACQCARTVLAHVLDGEERPRAAIEAAERWADIPSEQNRIAAAFAADAAAAAAAAFAAADAAAAAAAAFAAFAAAFAAADTDDDAADAAAADTDDDAADAAAAAAFAADAAAADAATRKSHLSLLAKIIRETVPVIPESED